MIAAPLFFRKLTSDAAMQYTCIKEVVNVNRYIGKGILLGIYFVICAFFLRAFLPYIMIIRSSLPEILTGACSIPEIPENLIIAVIMFGIVNVVFFAQIIQYLSSKHDSDQNDSK